MRSKTRGNVLYMIFLLLAEICHADKQEIPSKYYSKRRKLELRENVRQMFHHAYDGYLLHASNYDELRPLTCDGHDTWGSYSLTLIDALDTLATMGNFSEFRRVATLLESKMNFDKDINVSVFETNIRIVGGLLSAHLLSKRAGVQLETGWPCQGPLLRMAEDVARRLLPAFETATGMPYGTVNLRYGVPKGETSVTCTAGVGTFLVEFGTLSRLTGNSIYEEVALNALYALWDRRSSIGLFGNHIDVQTGRWTALDSGIGAGVDSFFEYLVKGAILLNRPDLLELFNEARISIDKYLRKDDWYIWAGMNKGQITLPVFQSLESFWPGILSIIGDHEPAVRTITNYISVWQKYGFLPEFYNIPTGDAAANREVYPLRPELVESAMYLYRSTKNQMFLEFGESMLETLEFSAKTRCGYATIRNVVTHEKENRMESFFLAETTKYLFLLFDEDNFLHNNAEYGERLDTSQGECIVHAGSYIFNTEAHPMDMSALHCCHNINEDIYAGLDFDKFRDVTIMKAERESYINKEVHCHFKTNIGSSDMYEMDYASPSHSKTSDTSIISVDVQVFDEHNNPADDVLVENFERVKQERELNRSIELHGATRNQLTVNDLQEFFERNEVLQLQDAIETLAYVRKFMRNFTMDVAFIRGLQILDRSLTNILGSSIQNEFESRMRTLWELYDLEQRYIANVKLIRLLELLSKQNKELQQQQLGDMLDILDEHEHRFGNPSTVEQSTETHIGKQVVNAVHETHFHYKFALINTTAMQEFLRRIYLSGTSEDKLNYKPFLDAKQLETLDTSELPAVEARELFVYTRRIIDFKKHMTDTVSRLQTLMQDKVQSKEETVKDKNNIIAPKIYAAELTKTEHIHKLNTEPNESTKSLVDDAAKSKETTNTDESIPKDSHSVWSQLVQTILRQTGGAPRTKFNENMLLEKTRKSLQKYNSNKAMKYSLFTCKRPTFIESYAYREYYPTTTATATAPTP